MKCRECAQARRYSAVAIRCIEYGMILNKEHECTKKGAELREQDDDQRGESDDEAEAGHPGERGA